MSDKSKLKMLQFVMEQLAGVDAPGKHLPTGALLSYIRAAATVADVKAVLVKAAAKYADEPNEQGAALVSHAADVQIEHIELLRSLGIDPAAWSHPFRGALFTVAKVHRQLRLLGLDKADQ